MLGVPELPAGKVKTDQFFGKVETYRGTVVVKLPLAGAAAGQSVVLTADSQGCADVGVCYPPTRQKVTLALPAAGAGPTARWSMQSLPRSAGSNRYHRRGSAA